MANDEGAEFASWRGETQVGKAPWFESLQAPPGLEEELQSLLTAGSPEDLRGTLGPIFRRAILLHQRTGTEGYLGSSGPRAFSVIVGNLFACAVANKILYLLLDDAPSAWEAYDVSVSGRTDGELVWAKVGLGSPALQAVLEDEEVWAAYGRMLGRFHTFTKAQSNHLNVGKMSVLTGERLGRHRWVLERTLAWLARYRRLLVRYERRADIHEAFVHPGCALICLAGYARA